MEWKIENSDELVLKDGSFIAVKIQSGVKENNPSKKHWVKVLIANTYLGEKVFFKMESKGINFLCFKRKFKTEEEKNNYIEYRKKELITILSKKSA